MENQNETQQAQATDPRTALDEARKRSDARHSELTAKLDELNAAFAASKVGLEAELLAINAKVTAPAERPIPATGVIGKSLAVANDFLDKALYVAKPVVAVVAVGYGAFAGGRAVYNRVTAKPAAPPALPSAPDVQVH